MKKIFMTLSVGAMFSAAIILGGCNNAEEVKKQTEAQDASIQALVDSKLSGLQDQVNAECTAKVDSIAGVTFETWKLAEAKGSKKPVTKKVVKTKTVTKTETKTETTISNRQGTNQNSPSTITNRAGTNESKTNSSTISNRQGATKTVPK